VAIPAQISAPGKLMIVGEYAVLEGAPAVVAAVDMRVRLRPLRQPIVEPFSTSLPPEASAARECAEAICGALETELMLDVSALRSGDQKLGVGSSAAAAAATAGFVFANAGHDLGDEAVRQQVLRCALDGHRAVAPRGSGADVAACTLGGFVRFQRLDSGEVRTAPLTFPSHAATAVVWTGQQVRTSDMLDRIEALRQRDRGVYQRHMADLAESATDFIAALARDDVASLIAHTHDYGLRMAALGEAAGAPIVETTLARIAALAQKAGGAAKPSGAGGGDVALALFPSQKELTSFADICSMEHLHVLPYNLGVRGVGADIAEE